MIFKTNCQIVFKSNDLNERNHREHPLYYPAPGTVGRVICTDTTSALDGRIKILFQNGLEGWYDPADVEVGVGEPEISNDGYGLIQELKEVIDSMHGQLSSQHLSEYIIEEGYRKTNHPGLIIVEGNAYQVTPEVVTKVLQALN